MNIIALFKSFIHDEDAQAIIEYALVLCILTLASYGAIKLFIAAWRSKFNRIVTFRSGVIGMAP